MLSRRAVFALGFAVGYAFTASACGDDPALRSFLAERPNAVAHSDGAYLELGVAGEQRYDAGAYRSQAKNAKNRFCGHNQRSLTGRQT